MTIHRRPYTWVLANLIVLPLSSWAVFLIVAEFVAFVSLDGVDWGLTLPLLPVLMAFGAVYGAALGMVQGLALRGYGMALLTWTIATTIGMCLDFVVIGGIMLVQASGNPVAPHSVGALAAESARWILYFVHGCTLAAVQWLAFRKHGWRQMSAWIWLAGIAWSILTPFLFVFLLEAIETIAPKVQAPSAIEVLVLFLPSLLLSLPYIVVTTYLLERHATRQHVEGDAV